MGQIATLGDITFEVHSDRVMTPQEIEHTAVGRWADHNVVGAKPKGEFIGPGLNEMVIPIQLSAALGINPREEFEKIGTFILQGRHAPFVLGERVIGNGEWRIETNTTIMKKFDGNGNVLYMELELHLKEYF